MVTVRIPGVSQSTRARALAAELTAGTAGETRRTLIRMLADAAGSDGNRHLDLAEVGLVKGAFDAASGPGGVDLGAFETRTRELLASRVTARDQDGIRAYFTESTPNINELIIREMREVIALANGRPVELNTMIFSFVDPLIGDAILDMARQHPNASFRLIADFGQLSETGNRQPPRLARIAAEEGLTNIGVRFKKDAPYVWDARAGRPAYVHTATKGLNHHKGFVALIDGHPVKLVTGSYNWSPTADDKNYEDLFVIDRTNPANRAVLNAYQAEFAAFYNHPDALSTAQARRHKQELFNALRVANGHPAQPLDPIPPAEAPYVPRPPSTRFDVNTLSDENHARLRALVGDGRVVASIVRQLASYGRFDSLDNLFERVPSAARLGEARRAALTDALEFGDGRVELNRASVSELERALRIPHALALAIVARREAAGDYESLEGLRDLPGMTPAIFERISPRINDDVARMFFSARPFGADAATTGYAAENAGRRVPVLGTDGIVAEQGATLGAGVTDLLRRAAPGEVARIAMYGMSVGTPEYAAIVEAANRGVHVKVVLNDDYNEGPAAALAELARQGKPVEVRVQKARTMHEKFGVVNDDFFFGTANMSGSSTTKHSEDRIVVKNNAEVAAQLVARFELLFARSRAVG